MKVKLDEGGKTIVENFLYMRKPLVWNISYIYLREFVSQNLSFRDSADKLFEYMNDLERFTIFLDFAGVIFMSRTFAHQYLKNKDVTSKEIIEINKTFTVTKMFE